MPAPQMTTSAVVALTTSSWALADSGRKDWPGRAALGHVSHVGVSGGIILAAAPSLSMRGVMTVVASAATARIDRRRDRATRSYAGEDSMDTQLWRWDAVALAAAIRTGKIGSREATQAVLARLEAVNPKLNAVTVVLAEQAVAAADRAGAP